MSDPNYLKMLHEKRNMALAQARTVIDDATQQNRSTLTASEEATYSRAHAEMVELDEQIRAVVARDEAAAVADEARASVEHLVRPAPGNGAPGPGTDLDRWFRSTTPEPAYEIDPTRLNIQITRDGLISVTDQRAIYGYAGAGTLGGLAPTITEAQLYSILLDQGAIWKMGPDIRATTDGLPRRWPTVTAYGTATITAEGGTLVQADPTLGSIITTPAAYKILTKVSSELVQDSVVDVGGFVADVTAKALAKSYGPNFATGSGTGQPQGYMTGGSITVSAAGTCTPDSWIRLQHSVTPPYRANGKFVTNDGVASYVRRLRADAGGTTGPWLVAPPLAPGALEMAFGSPLVIDNNIAAHGSAVKSVAFGDWASGYLVHDGGFRYEQSLDAYFGTDEVGYRGIWRLDGRVRDLNAYGIYQATAN
jgi:HK97 family phage major capsid protein